MAGGDPWTGQAETVRTLVSGGRQVSAVALGLLLGHGSCVFPWIPIFLGCDELKTLGE